MNTIYFATSNKDKLDEYNKRLTPLGWKVKQLKVEFSELQSLDCLEITEHKLQQAKRKFPKRKIIVDDRGLFITALNNFPGPYLKPVLQSIGVKGLLKLMEDLEDRTAKYISVIGYYDGKKDHFIVSEERGFIRDQERGSNIRGWTDLLLVYSHESLPNKTLAELDDDEWKSYLEVLKDQDSILKLVKIL